MKRLDLYTIDIKYVRSLAKKDDHVMSVSPQREKQNRPFVGVVVLLNGQGYCIPLTSPKEKFKHMKSQVDFIKIFDPGRKDENGADSLIGVLNINNMIPVAPAVIQKIDLHILPQDSPADRRYKELMQKQIAWCRNHESVITARAQKVYQLVTQTPEVNRHLTKRCLDFLRLETVLQSYLMK